MIGISEELTVIRPGGALSPRCAGVLEAALAGRQAEVLSRLEGPLTGRRLLFVVSLDEGGVNRGFYDLLAHLRTHPNCLDRCVGSVLVDAPGDLYTKAAGRDLVLAANLAGCALWVALWWKALAICGTSRSRPETLAVLWKRPTIWRRRIWWSGCWPLPPPAGAAEAAGPPRLQPGHLQHPGPVGAGADPAGGTL